MAHTTKLCARFKNTIKERDLLNTKFKNTIKEREHFFAQDAIKKK